MINREYLSDFNFLILVSILILLFALFAQISSFIFPGPDTVVLTMLQLLFIFMTVLNKRIQLPSIRRAPKVAAWIALGWILLSIVSSINGLDAQFAILNSAELVIQILFIVCLVMFFRTYDLNGLHILMLVIIGFLLYLPYFGIYHLFTPVSPLHEVSIINLSAVGFNNIRHFGYYLTIVLIFSYGACLYVKFKWHHPAMWVALITSIIAWTLIFWSGGRGPIFAFFVSLILFLLWVRVALGGRLTVLIVSTALIGLMISPTLPKGMGADRIWLKFESSSNLNEFSANRIKFWRNCLSDIAERPLLGNGAYGFNEGCGSEFGNYSHPHGFHIQAPLDWGIPGALLFFCLISLVLWYAWLGIKDNKDISINSLGFWLGLMILVYSTIDGTLYHRFSVIFFSLAIALMFCQKTESLLRMKERQM